MGLFNTKSSEEKRFIEIERYLLDGEEIVFEVGTIDKAFITNYRVIFKDISISLKGDLMEMVFIPFSKIDGVSFVELNKITFNRAVRIKTGGFRHDIGFAKSEEKDCLELCTRLNKILLEQT